MRNRFIEGASNTTGHQLGNYVSAGIPKINLVTSSSGSHNHTFTGNAITGSLSASGNSLSSSSSITNTGCLSFSDFSLRSAAGNSSYSNYPGTISFSATVKGTLNDEANHSHTITAQSSETIYGKSTTVQPKALMLNYLIKY